MLNPNRWRPTATLDTLHARASIIEQIRAFFKARKVLEVSTPVMLPTTVTDPSLDSFEVPSKPHSLYLQTSPEYTMKRLLAAGSGCIYQIAPAFRQEEMGRKHQIEFAMLEWYRIGFTDDELIDEIDTLLKLVLNIPPAIRTTYRAVFEQYLGFNPHQASLEFLHAQLKARDLYESSLCETVEDSLYMLMSLVVEPALEQVNQPVFVKDFPASQAALARKKEVDGDQVAGRFELYFKGLELANGYYELTDPQEQQRRFEMDIAKRKELGKPAIQPDYELLEAMKSGLPPCSGVALGLDRLIMIALHKMTIQEVQCFAVGALM